MLKVQQNFNLKKYNTFGIEATATAFVEVKNMPQLKQALDYNAGRLPIIVLGGGSNMLFTQPHYDCFFIKNSIKRKLVKTRIKPAMFSYYHGKGRVCVEFGGGELWHEAVQWAIQQDLGGLENLSLIPGTVGAAPIQNIGAYGVELDEIFISLNAVNLTTGESRIFTPEDCAFSYRDSVFKHALKGQYFISLVRLKLTQSPYHVLKTSYGDIQKQLAEKGITQPTIRDIADTVIAIRQSKLPDPSVIGNAGSFFKNPELSANDFNKLKSQNPDVVSYPTEGGRVKVAAGWLIEQCGWKGKRLGAIGVHERQALVLVNYGGGSGAAIYQLAMDIQASVMARFGVMLTPEVNVL